MQVATTLLTGSKENSKNPCVPGNHGGKVSYKSAMVLLQLRELLQKTVKFKLLYVSVFETQASQLWNCPHYEKKAARPTRHHVPEKRRWLPHPG